MEPNNKKKRSKILAFAFAIFAPLLVVALAITGVNFGGHLFGVKADTLFQVVLDNTNSVNSSGDVVQYTKRHNQVTFTYANVSAPQSGYHTTLNDGGSLVNKDILLSVDNFTVAFNGTGSLKARISYDTKTWGEYFTVVSDQQVNTGSQPYFIELKADGGAVNIQSATYNLACVDNPAAESKEEKGSYEITFNAAGSDGSTELGTSSASMMAQVTSGSNYISSFEEDGSKVYSGEFGLKLGSKNNTGNLTINFSTTTVSNPITTVDVSSAQYGTDTGKLYVYVNGSDSYTEITPSEGGSVGVNGTLTSLTIETSYRRAYLCGLNLNYDNSIEPGAPDTPTYEVGFTATDDGVYTTNSIYATDKSLSVKSIDNLGNKVTINEGGLDGYSYVVKNSSNVAIDPTEKFPAEGVYTVHVSYKNYIPAEITLNVGEYIYMTDVAASMTTTTFNTATTLSNELTGNLTATIEYSNNTTSEAIEYSSFAEIGLGIKLLNPKGISGDINSPFGTAGTWKLKVYDLANEEMYYEIYLTVNAIPVETITLSETSYAMYVDDTLQLTASVNPSNATNSEYVWESADTSIATVDENGLVTAVAVGGTTISALAQDGSGVVGTCAITVSAKPAAPTWEEVTDASSIAVGDVILITYNNSTTQKELDGIYDGSTDYGIATDFNTTPSGLYPLRVEEGSSSGTFALKNGSDYLYWNSGNSLTTSSTISANSSWEFSGTSTIKNAADTTRKLQYNTNSPRFACYTTSQAALTLYIQTNATPVTPVYPTSISLSGTASSIAIGETSQLTVGYTPSDTNVKNVTFASSNESVATVSSSGLITGVAQGNATITATAEAESGTTTATFDITVTPIAVTSVSLSSNSETVKVGKTVTLTATVYPTNATNKNVTWSSSNTGIATVSGGVVTGVAAGTATITVTTVDGSKTATCTVVVQEASAGGEETFSITYTDLPSTYQTGSTVYTADSGIKFQAYNCANYSSKMQFKASSGYLQTTEELELQSITINDRESNSLTVYGSNTAGSFSTEISGTNDVYDLTGYSYFKVARTSSGAAYCSSITVVTGTPTPTDPTDITLSPSSVELAPNGTKQVSVSYIPSNANQNKDITWTSSNSNVATVSSDGLISVKSTATAGQTATITATLTNIASIYKTVSVTVVEQSKDDHTVLIYMCGADLESENQLATGDIQEILKVSGQPDDVNVVIETGGASSWASTYGISSTYLERYHVENKSLVRDNQLTYASMGLTSTLQSFIEYGLNNYPADRTGIIFWNHGGGMRGVCYDEKKNDDVLKNSEIRSALSGALSNCGMSGQKLEWVGYDACLMAVQDIAITNSEYFNYMIASEESEAGYGWDYDNWVDDLYAKKTTPTILKAIVDSFISDNGGASSSSGDQTLSYMDLSYAAAYKTAWENLATQLNSKVTSSNKSSFNSAITSNVKHYADSDYDYFCTFDAWDFVDKLANNSAFSSFKPDESYTTAVKNAHANLVAYNLAQKGAGVSKGLCMYWPNSTQYSDVSTYYTTSETTLTTWRSFCVNKGYHA